SVRTKATTHENSQSTKKRFIGTLELAERRPACCVLGGFLPVCGCVRLVLHTVCAVPRSARRREQSICAQLSHALGAAQSLYGGFSVPDCADPWRGYALENLQRLEPETSRLRCGYPLRVYSVRTPWSRIQQHPFWAAFLRSRSQRRNYVPFRPSQTFMNDECFFNELWIACYKAQIDGYPFGHPRRINFKPIVPFTTDGDTYNRQASLKLYEYPVIFSDEEKKELLDTK